MSNYKTASDLVQKVLGNLGIVAAGQDPSPEDTAKVANNLDAIFALLAAREIVQVPDTNSIPLAWFLPLAACAAFELIEEFGIVGEEAAVLEKKSIVAEARLKVMLRGRPTYEALKADWL